MLIDVDRLLWCRWALGVTSIGTGRRIGSGSEFCVANASRANATQTRLDSACGGRPTLRLWRSRLQVLQVLKVFVSARRTIEACSPGQRRQVDLPGQSCRGGRLGCMAGEKAANRVILSWPGVQNGAGAGC